MVILSVLAASASPSASAEEGAPSARMTLRHITADGAPDRAALRDMQRDDRYHRRRSSASLDQRRRSLVDYGGGSPYDYRADEHDATEHHRKLDDDGNIHRKNFQGWKPIRIHVNTDYLDVEIKKRSDDVLAQQKIAYLRDDVFPEAVRRFRDVLRVYPAERLEIDKESACPGYGIAVQYDLVVFAFADCDDDRDGDGRPDSGRIANGKSCQADEYDRPVAGFAGMCLDAIDLATERGRKITLETVMHEFVHILGFYWEDFVKYRHPRTGLPRTPLADREETKAVTCTDGTGKQVIMPSDDTLRAFVNPKTGDTQYEITTETVTAVARNQFGCSDLTGAWLEDRQEGAGSDCFGSHWDFRLFSTEFMTASATATDQYMSPLTVALLEDTGWYRADYNSDHVKLSPFGRLAGCDFVYEDCVVNGQIPSYSKGSFCTSQRRLGCDPTHTSVARCSQFKYKKQLPPEFQYFSDPFIGGRNEQLDYCPVYGTLKFSFDSANDDLGYDRSAFELDCSDADLQSAPFSHRVESFGEDGRCFDTNFERPLCLKASCSRERNAVEVVFGDTIRTCLYDFQTIDIPGLPGYSLTCPRLAQVCPELVCKADCAGRGECVVDDEEDPYCSCNDSDDPSPYCANSPVASLVPTVSPAPTLPKGSAYGRYASNPDAGRSGGSVSMLCWLVSAAWLGMSIAAQVLN